MCSSDLRGRREEMHLSEAIGDVAEDRVQLPDGCICVDLRRNDAVRIEAQIRGCPVPAKLAPYIFHLEGNSELCGEPYDLLDIGRCPAAEEPQHEALMPTEPPCRLRLQGARRRHRTIA